MKKAVKEHGGKKLHASRTATIIFKCTECGKIYNNEQAMERAETFGCISCGAYDSLVEVASQRLDFDGVMKSFTP